MYTVIFELQQMFSLWTASGSIPLSSCVPVYQTQWNLSYELIGKVSWFCHINRRFMQYRRANTVFILFRSYSVSATWTI